MKETPTSNDYMHSMLNIMFLDWIRISVWLDSSTSEDEHNGMSVFGRTNESYVQGLSTDFRFIRE